MKLVRTEDAVGQVLCHDITQIIPGVVKRCCFPEGTYCYRRRHSGTFICGKRESLYLGKTGRYAS